MNNKFYDIIPPEINEEKKMFNGKLPGKKKKSRLLEFFIGILLFTVVAGFFLYFQLPKATITIWPKTTLLSFKEVVVIDQNVAVVDLIQKIIPAEIIEARKEIWRDGFPSEGVIKEEGKARGKIKVYNKYSPFTPLNLVKETRFLSDSGKYFISLNPIYIPAATQRGTEIIPGVVEIEVIALKAGEDHNIDTAEFSVPGLAGTPYYYTTYAQSEQPMTGGFVRETKYVGQDDINKAKGDLTQQLLNDIEVALKNKISSNSIILDDAISKDITELMPLVVAGDKVDQFSVQGVVEGKALVFERGDLETFVKDYIFSKIPGSQDILEESLEITYTPEKIDLEKGQIILNLEFSAKIYPRQDKFSLFDLIKGKRVEEIKETIYLSYPEDVFRVEVDFWPFWVNKLPNNIKRLNIETRIE